jgi:hypothetical protein
MYRADCISLLFTSPSRLYHIVLSHFRGDVTSTDLSFSILFLSPLVLLLGKSEAARELLDLAKLGKDKEFLELVARLMGGGGKIRNALEASPNTNGYGDKKVYYLCKSHILFEFPPLNICLWHELEMGLRYEECCEVYHWYSRA